MTRGKTSGTDLAFGAGAIAIASVAADGSAPKTIQLLAIGANPSRNGKPPVVIVADRAHAERVAAATASYHRSNKVVVDYDHQTMFGARPGVGGTAKAAGWMPRIYATDEGVFADVDWTEAAASAIGALEYRYISPVFQHDAQGRAIRIINAALTNMPSLDLAAVASAFSSEEGIASMSYANIAKALGLGDDAGEEEVLRAIANLNGGTAMMTAIATALGAEATADLVAAATALKEKADNAGNPDPAKFVPVETVAQLTTSVQSLQGTVDSLQAKDRAAKIAQAQKDGCLPPALVAHATSLSAEQLDEFLGKLPQSGLGKPAVDDPSKLNADGKLTDEQIALCSSMGWDQAAYLEMLKTEAE